MTLSSKIRLIIVAVCVTVAVKMLMNWWGCTHKNYILTNTVHFLKKFFLIIIIAYLIILFCFILSE